ncbi:MAG TPA: hypothetical protein VEP68_04585 [Anaeromyxobacteraceae bacterium]|nr:hypothetical protein [Anaeromyxobacteraceae bacterium]
MNGRVALAALALAAPAAADVPGRLSASVLAGGGWASDIFVGAGAGDNGFAQVIPSGRLDLALAPAWKLSALAELYYGTYRPSGFTTLSEWGALEGRWLPGEPWEVSLTASLEHADFNQGAPLDPGLVTSPTVTAATGWRLAPAARLRLAGWDLRASFSLAERRSRAEGQPVYERLTAAVLSASRRLGSRFDLSLAAKASRSDSDRPDYAFQAASILAGAGARLFQATRLEASVLAQVATFETSTRETLVRLTLAATQPLWEGVDLEAAWSYVDNGSDDPAHPSASRQVVFLGLTGRTGSLTW